MNLPYMLFFYITLLYNQYYAFAVFNRYCSLICSYLFVYLFIAKTKLSRTLTRSLASRGEGVLQYCRWLKSIIILMLGQSLYRHKTRFCALAYRPGIDPGCSVPVYCSTFVYLFLLFISVLLFDYSVFDYAVYFLFWYWHCIPGISILHYNNHPAVNKHHTSDSAIFWLSKGSERPIQS